MEMAAHAVAGLEDAELAGAGERFDAVVGAEFFHRPLQVGLDGVAGEPERGGDGRVGLAHGDSPEDFVFAPGEAVFSELAVEDHPGVVADVRADDPLARDNLTNFSPSQLAAPQG